MNSCNKPANNFSAYSVKIGKHTAWVEIANTEPKKTLGLMYRQSLPKDSGMLFVYHTPDRLSFWMKNTLIPLTIAFIRGDGKITDIIDMKPYDGSPDHLLPHYSSSQVVSYALEMQQGWFQEKKIQVGDIVEFPPEIQPIIKPKK